MEGNQSDPADRVDAHDVSLVWTGQSRLDRPGTPSPTICTEYRAKLLSCRHYFLDGGSKNGRGIKTIRPELCLLPGSKTIITSRFAMHHLVYANSQLNGPAAAVMGPKPCITRACARETIPVAVRRPQCRMRT